MASDELKFLDFPSDIGQFVAIDQSIMNRIKEKEIFKPLNRCYLSIIERIELFYHNSFVIVPSY